MQQPPVTHTGILGHLGLSRRRLLELTIEVLIALALVAVVILYAEFGPFSWVPSIRWWGLAGMTGAGAWTAITEYRQAWRQGGFWLTLTGLLSVHSLAWTLVLLRTPVWPLIWFAIPVPIEGAVFVLVMDKLGYDRRRPRKRGVRSN